MRGTQGPTDGKSAQADTKRSKAGSGRNAPGDPMEFIGPKASHTSKLPAVTDE